MTLDELRERRQKANDEALDIKATTEAEKRDLTVEEAARLDECLATFDRLTADINRMESLNQQTEMLAQPTGRKTSPVPPAKSAPDDEDGETPPALPANRKLNRPTHDYLKPRERSDGGFRNFGEMAWHVRRAALNAGPWDPRLERLAAASTYGSEGVGADGGFAIPPDFRTAIMELVSGEESLLSRCDQYTVNGNSFTCPVDETTPWQTSGGILANWEGEAAAAAQTKPALGEVTTKLHKLRVLVPVTEELLDDASGLDAYLRKKAPEKISFKVTAAILGGTGAGMPMGILNSPCLVTQAAEGSQVSTTLVANNVIKMYTRLYAPSRANAVWLINQDIEPQLYKLSIPGTDNTGNAVTGWGGMVYLPANGLSQSPYGTLFGKPVIPTQACSTLGTVGDIILADFSQYMAVLKSGPNPRLDISIHLWFDQDLVAYKFLLRMGGKPWWSQAASALNGSNTYSPFVALAAR